MDKEEFLDDQYQLAYPDGIENHWWNSARNQIIAKELNSLGKPDGSILDVGCGRGIVVDYLRKAGIDCRGVELAKATPIHGLEEYTDYGVKASDIEQDKRDKTDTILLLDVIEHIADPVSFLEEFPKYFTNVKTILITVPARQELWSNYDDFYGHHRRYSLEMIEELAETFNWRIRTNSYFFRMTYPPLYFLSKIAKERPIQNIAPVGLGKILHRFVAKLIQWEQVLLPSRIYGSSIIATLEIK